jgi:DNA-3-methyladenine glycosylase II
MTQYFEYSHIETDYLKSKDVKMARLIEKVGHIYRTVNPDLYSCLTDSIVGQQISTAAHNTIRNRIFEKFGTLTPEKVVEIPDEELKSVGISYRKAGYIKDFSQKIVNGEFDIVGLNDMSDAEAIEKLVSLKGVGKWTAEMMLTFSMSRPDVLSYGDLAIRRGIMKLYGLEELSEKEFHNLTDKFSPYRTTAALYFWRYSAPDCDFTIE